MNDKLISALEVAVDAAAEIDDISRTDYMWLQGILVRAINRQTKPKSKTPKVIAASADMLERLHDARAQAALRLLGKVEQL